MVEYINITISMSSLLKMDEVHHKMPQPNLILLLSISTATWIAVVTATISFWRTTRRPPNKESVANVPGNDLIESACGDNKESDAIIHLSSSDKMDTDHSLRQQVLEAPKRLRFTTRYENYAWEECEEEEKDYEVNDEGENEEREVRVSTRWDMGVKGDLGWYRCQDFSVFDGNVVRFWDCGYD